MTRRDQQPSRTELLQKRGDVKNFGKGLGQPENL